MFTGLTPDLCKAAVGLVLPSIEHTNAMLNRPQGHLVILDPSTPYEPKFHKGFEDKAFSRLGLYSRTIGGPNDKYERICWSKAYVSFVTGMPSHLVQFEAPWAYEPGMTKFGGSAVETFGGNSRLIVAYSGAPWYFDYMYCRMMIAAIQATCRQGFASTLDDPDIMILGRTGLDPEPPTETEDPDPN